MTSLPRSQTNWWCCKIPRTTPCPCSAVNWPTPNGASKIWLNASQQGIFTSSTRQRLEELEQLRDNVKASILQAELEHPQYNREDIIEWISRFRYGDPNDKAYQRHIIDIFLNSIYVFDDKLVFTYNYKNGSQTVSLSDVFTAFGSDSRSRTPPKAPTERLVLFSLLLAI